MFTVALPVFVIVTLWVLFLPTTTFPKLTLVELEESSPVFVPGLPEPALVRPTQLERPVVARIRARVSNAAKGRRAKKVPCSEETGAWDV